MSGFPEPLAVLISNLAKLPGVGSRSAQRIAFSMLKMSDEKLKTLSDAIGNIKNDIKTCEICGGITDKTPCSICADSARSNVICVVTSPADVFSIESMNEFSGKYHVLNGTLSPIAGIGPNDINIASLIKRVSSENVNEIILATNPDVDGEATAAYITGLLKPLNVLVTHLAYGIPMGGSLEYIDPVTLSIALSGRRKL